MAVVRRNFVWGATDVLLLVDGVVLSSPGLADVPAIVAPDFAWLSLDPYEQTGPGEVVKVTAHTASATTATIERGQQQAVGGSPARQHASGTRWEMAPTVEDFDTTASDARITAAEAAIVALQAAIAAIDEHPSVRLATAAALAANTRTGDVLTASANGAMATIDGVAPAVGDRVLVKDEVTAANRGVYVVTSLGSAGAPWVLTRAPDANTSAEVTAGLYVSVDEGSTLADTGWLLTTNNPITLNTTGLTFTRFPPAAAGGVVARICHAHLATANQSIPNNTLTAINLNAETDDPFNLHDTVTNNSRVVLDQVGWWLCVGSVSYAANATGRRAAAILRNGTLRGFQQLPAHSDVVQVQVTYLVKATATTDYVQVAAIQDSGGALDAVMAADNTYLQAVFLGT